MLGEAFGGPRTGATSEPPNLHPDLPWDCISHKFDSWRGHEPQVRSGLNEPERSERVASPYAEIPLVMRDPACVLTEGEGFEPSKSLHP